MYISDNRILAVFLNGPIISAQDALDSSMRRVQSGAYYHLRWLNSGRRFNTILIIGYKETEEADRQWLEQNDFLQTVGMQPDNLRFIEVGDEERNMRKVLVTDVLHSEPNLRCLVPTTQRLFVFDNGIPGRTENAGDQIIHHPGDGWRGFGKLFGL